MGRKNKRKYGCVTDITTTTERTLSECRTSVRKKSGIRVSVTSMSFEKRLRILPIGVDSKNCMLQRSIEPSIDSWNFLAALTYILAYNKSPHITNKP